MAKEALNRHEVDIQVKPEVEEIVSIAKGNIMQNWQDRWNNDNRARFYHALEPEVNSAVKFHDINRRREVTVTRLRFGHCRLNKQLHLMGIHENGLCSQCNVPEDVPHYLLHCDKYNDLRRELVGQATQKNVDVTVRNLLTKPELGEALWSYIRATNADI